MVLDDNITAPKLKENKNQSQPNVSSQYFFRIACKNFSTALLTSVAEER